MPFVSIDYVAGLSADRRRQLQERLAAVVVQEFSAPPSNVRVFTRALDLENVYMASGAHEVGLPVIRVEFLPGRTLDQKRALVKGLGNVAAEILGVPVPQIRTVLYERSNEEWARGDRLMIDQI